MDLKVEHELIPLVEVNYDGIQEHGVELDYILPDYYPDIFRLVKYEAIPEVTSYTFIDGKINYELCVSINILYCSENSKQINILRQKLTYSSTVDIPHSQSEAEIILCPKTDYVNCRVVNQKRVDVKGAVTVKIKVCSEGKQEMICNATGLNVQLKKQPVEYAVGKLHACKNVSVSEEIELSHSKPQVNSVIRVSSYTSEPDMKVVYNKLITKGNIDVEVLYSCEDSGAPSMETMKFTVPYSQILDINGLDETYRCYVDISVKSCEVSAMADNDGNMYKLKCEMSLQINCSAMKSAFAELITDIYSTRYPCEYNMSGVKISCMPVPFSERVNEKFTLECTDGKIDKVYDVWCSVGNTVIKTDINEKNIVINAMLRCSMMYRDAEGMPVIIEKENTYEHKLRLPEADECSYADAELVVCGCTYSLVSADKVSVNVELKINGKTFKSSEIEAVSDIKINTDELKKPEGDYALKLYFGMSGESIWDIAKKYSTSVNAVMEENNLYDERLQENSMLLIPMVK